MSYDANGNILSYDVDGAQGRQPPRSIAYDGENRPVSVTRNGNVTRFDYGPDGERAGKSFLSNSFVYAGAEAEALFNPANPTGLLTSFLHADIKREGQAADILLKDHLASNRLVLRVGNATVSRTDYSPFGQPLTSNGSVLRQGKGYLNERGACPWASEAGPEGPGDRPPIRPDKGPDVRQKEREQESERC